MSAVSRQLGGSEDQNIQSALSYGGETEVDRRVVKQVGPALTQVQTAGEQVFD